MKTKQKAIVLVMCAALLVAASVFGTFAYLTDNDSVTNTFTVGQVHLTLDESKTDTEGKGIPVTPGERTTDGNNYHLLPGHAYTKDPTVTVLENSEDAYVRMIVTVNFSEQLDTIFSSTEAVKSGVKLENIFLGYNSQKWKLEKVTENDDNTRTYEFRYANIVKSSTTDTELYALFTGIKVPDFLTNEQLATLVTKDNDGKITDQLNITVVAHAIQADGFDDADAAWTAFESIAEQNFQK